MDVLSDVLNVIRLSGAVFITADFSSDWSISSPPLQELARALMPGAASMSLFHVLHRGRCWVGLEGGEPLRMTEGDVVVAPRATQHVMASRTDAPAIPITSIIELTPSRDIPRIRHGGGGETASFVCGYLRCDQRFDLLMKTLPDLIHVRRRECDSWLDHTLGKLVAEAGSPHSGSAALLSRLVELMFVEVLRRHMMSMPEGNVGWLAGLRDPCVGGALKLLHAHPARDWTVGDLSREVGVCRSRLADRFTDLIGESPMRYLAAWRMQLARSLLLDEDLSLCQVARRVGYESEAAFNRAFKRIVGVPPATWRRQHEPAG